MEKPRRPHRAQPNHLRALRLAQEMSQAALRIASGVSVATIVTIELHGLVPVPDVRQRLAEALDVDEGEIWPHLAEPCAAS